MTDFVAKQRYQAIRKQLDQLHYCLPFNVASSALVERLLNDLLKTTEAYQLQKNKMQMVQHDEKLNQQALLPLQKENEKITKENNKLHHEIIKVREETDNSQVKWKAALRQLQEECQDMKFLVDTKDGRIKKLDQQVTSFKLKMQSTLDKIYLPGQDRIVEGLSQFNDEGGNNLLQGHEQSMEMSNVVQKVDTFGDQKDGTSAISSGLQVQDNLLVDQNQWATEVRKADERGEQLQQIVQDLTNKLNSQGQLTKELVGKIKVRDDEILRLHELYMPAQNLDKLNIKFQYEQNEQAVQKLQNQVDFLNRENDKLQRQCDLLKGDGDGNMAVAQYESMKQEVDELAFQNSTLRKDYEECRKQLSFVQQDLNLKLQEEEKRIAHEQRTQEQLEKQQRDLQSLGTQHQETNEKNHNLKSAFNADKQMLREKIVHLEAKLADRLKEVQSQQQKVHMLTQSESSMKNELNFWNGKVTTMRRDSESLSTFAEKMQAENRKLQVNAEVLRVELETKAKDLILVRREVGGLTDDNERLRRMFDIVQKEAFNGVEKPLKAGAPDAGEQKVKKGYQPLRNDPPMPSAFGSNPQNKKTQNMWQIVDDGFGSSRDLSNITAVNGMSDIGTSKDQQMTIKQHQQY